jgi:hypothetical protein
MDRDGPIATFALSRETTINGKVDAEIGHGFIQNYDAASSRLKIGCHRVVETHLVVGDFVRRNDSTAPFRFPTFKMASAPGNRTKLTCAEDSV